MHPEAKKALGAKVQEIARLHSRQLAEFTFAGSMDEFLHADVSTASLLEKEVIDSLLNKYKWGVTHSEGYIRKQLDRIIASAVTRGEVADSLDMLIEQVETYSREQQVYVPLVGIEMQIDPLQLGNVTLLRMTKERCDQVVDRLHHIAMEQRSETSQQFVKIHESRIRDFLLDRACFEYIVVAEPIRAKELALEEAARALDVMRFAIPYLYHPNARVFIGIQGEIHGEARLFPVLSNQIFTLSYERAGHLGSFSLTEAELKHLEGIGVFEFSKILRKEASEVTEFESKLLDALHWFAGSQTQMEQANRFLNLSTMFLQDLAQIEAVSIHFGMILAPE